MKYLTFTVPCYNSQDYLHTCVDSLLTGGDDVEIILVNDGSTDQTLTIANDYRARYPGIVRVVDKENGGHGSGVNAGMALAEGLYFKVVDSDDRVEPDALRQLLEVIKRHVEEGAQPDLYVVNFAYEHTADNTRYVSRYGRMLPIGKTCGWEDVKGFRGSHMLLMHALVYRTEVLRASGLKLPEHTFYVDDLFAYTPLPFVRALHYLDVDFYRYAIGRADQSVTITNMVARYEQMIRVMLESANAYTMSAIKAFPRGLGRYLRHALFVYMVVTMLYICADDSPERRAAYKRMWQTIKARDAAMWRWLRCRTAVGCLALLPWGLRGAVLRAGYRHYCKKLKLG